MNKPDETYQEFIYRAPEIASYDDIKIDANIQYFIGGVQENDTIKSILYTVTTIEELRIFSQLLSLKLITVRRGRVKTTRVNNQLVPSKKHDATVVVSRTIREVSVLTSQSE